MPDRLKYVHTVTDRYGKKRYYFRRRGEHVTVLPGVYGSAEFLTAYTKALKSTENKKVTTRTPGTFHALISTYFRSPEFNAKAQATQKEYRRILERFAAEHGDKMVRDLQRRHVIIMRDQMSDRPGAANTFLRTMSSLITFAIEREYRADNPFKGVKQFTTGKHEAWSPKEIEQFRQRWPVGTMQRRAFSLALFTLQRKSDLIRMTRADIDGDAIRVNQSKTGKPLFIPLHSTLRAELDEHPPTSEHLLTTSKGEPFGAVYFGAWFASAIDAAGLPDRCVLHGLRDTGAVELAHAGASHAQLKAVGGWSTDRMASRYIQEAEQRRLAASGIASWEERTAKV